MRTLVADGNFKQDHLQMKNPGDDVSLSDGQGYMVGKVAFETYIQSAPPLSKPVRLSSTYPYTQSYVLVLYS